MARAKECRAYAKKYFVWAQESDREELRRASLEMASYWIEAAMRMECLGDSHVEPKTERCLALIRLRAVN